ncbi:hypothetical protein [Lunatimonas salinarum]|uniref:hypothetical protein n=1 Tax=Lunatimonas salinarum TaxID=1774590 RepID=UPI001AE0A099|nr:hypothetical protein [Lunatimonas salinarum]
MDTIRKYGLLLGFFFLINQEMAELSEQSDDPKEDYIHAVEAIFKDHRVFNSKGSGTPNEKVSLFPHTRFFLNKQ